MKKIETIERYELESYDEIRELVDAGEIVECNCQVDDWCCADFLVEKDYDGGYVVREEYYTPIEDHDLSDFHLTRYINGND